MRFNYKVIIVFLSVIAFILRVIYINSIPPGVFDDEANYGYDAWLISQTGKDQWDNYLPLQFKGFGDYHLPITQYFIAFTVKIFGLNAFAIRLPSVIAGSLTIVVVFLLVKKIFRKDRNAELLGLLTATLLVFNPWHFVLSRLAMEANIGLLFTLLAVYFYIGHTINKKSLILTSIFSILSIYTYYGYRLFLFLFLLIFSIKNKSLRNIQFKEILLILIVSFILIFPVLKSFGEGGMARLRQVNFWQDVSIMADTFEYRGVCRLYINDDFCKLFFNKLSTLSQKFIYNYFNHFSPIFLFFPEPGKSWHLLPSSNSYFYLLDIVPFMMGILFFFKDKKAYPVFLLLILAPIADSLTGPGNFSRGFIIVIPVLIIIAMGWLQMYRLCAQKKISCIFILMGYSYLCISFFINYFIYFPKKQSIYTHYAYEPLFNYLKEVEDKYDNIYLSRINHDQRQYIFYLYYHRVPPSEYFMLKKEYTIENNGWIFIKKLGKYNFINQVGPIMNYPQKSLLVVDQNGIITFKNSKQEKKIIYYQDGQAAFNIYDIDELKKIYSY